MTARPRPAPGRAAVAAALLEVALPAVIVLAMWVKLSVFGVQIGGRILEDWAPADRSTVFGAIVSSLGPLLVLCAPCLLLRRGRRVAVLLAVDLALSVMVLADVVHFRFFSDVISMSALGATSQIALVLSNVAELLALSDARLFADLPPLAVAAIALHRVSRDEPPPRPRARRRGAVVLLASGLLLSLIPMRIAAARWDTDFAHDWFRFIGVRQIGLLNYHMLDGGRQLARWLRSGAVDPAERERVDRHLAARRASAPTSPHFGAARGRNVIVVMVESLNAYLVDLSIDGTPVMPNLARLRRRSMSFDRVFNQTWSASTADAEITTLQSIHPLSAGAVQTRFARHDFRGLPQVAAEHGYTTMAAHAYSGELWKRRELYPRFGFQRMYFLDAYTPGVTVGLGLSDVDFVRQTVPMLRAQPRPFFSFLITLSTHYAYGVPPEQDVIHPPELGGTLIGRYLDAVHHTDRALGELLDSLEHSGMLDSSVVVLFGDHPAMSLGERSDLDALLERYAGLPPRSAESEVRYWIARNRIPLIVHLPGDSLAGSYATSGGQLDIAPTLISLLGLPPGRMVSLGRDLTAEPAGFVVMRDGSFARGDTLCRTVRRQASEHACASLSTGAPIDARAAKRWAPVALEELRISDLLITGNRLRSAVRGP